LVSVEVLIKALTYSDAIALAAAGITIIYMATQTFNFAHASKFAWGFYIMFFMLIAVGGSPYYFIILAALFSGLLGVALYYCVNRWLLKAGSDMVTLMMSTLGVDLIFFAFLNIFADHITLTFKKDARFFLLESYDIVLYKSGDLEIMGIGPISFIVVLIIIITLHLFLTKTKFGIAMRLTIENPTLASILGINPEYIYLAAWFIGGALAGLGGAMLSLSRAGQPNVGYLEIIPMFSGAIVGGLYSVFGSLLGGFLIGMSQYLATAYLASIYGGWVHGYRVMIPLVFMVIALLFFPQGLGGIQWKKLFKGGGK
jgi:branched-chain amino acid transport system permease protein